MNQRWIFPILLVLAGLAAYHNSFQGPFLLDDYRHIVLHTGIRNLADPIRILSGTTRPLVALTFALNYAVSGLQVWSYHAVNLSIHLAAGLVLFALLRRHLRFVTAFFATLLWLVHPLQTQPVNYIVQRSELLMGLFYLLTLTLLARKRKALCVTACALGMASKPIMVTAPWMALFYDRFFLASSWKDLWQRRGRLHLGLFATYGVLLLCLLNGTEEYVWDAGFRIQDVPPWIYWLAQGKITLHYLRLVLWPDRLVFDYGWPLASGAGTGMAWLVLGLAAVWTVWACRRRSAAGFLGLWFFLPLATTMWIPLSDLAFEHRMYLALAAPAVAMAAAAEHWRPSRWMWSVICTAVVFGLGITTAGRNVDYQSAIALWKDTVSKQPYHPRARSNLGASFHMQGYLLEALRAYKTSLRLDPQQPDVYTNIGTALETLGDSEGALRNFKTALRLRPTHRPAAENLERLLRQQKISVPP